MNVYIKQMLRTVTDCTSHQIVLYLKCLVPELYVDAYQSVLMRERFTPLSSN